MKRVNPNTPTESIHSKASISHLRKERTMITQVFIFFLCPFINTSADLLGNYVLELSEPGWILNQKHEDGVYPLLVLHRGLFGSLIDLCEKLREDDGKQALKSTVITIEAVSCQVARLIHCGPRATASPSNTPGVNIQS